MHKGLIFDLDGVIVDTAKFHYLAWKDLANELEINFTIEDNERLKGVSRNRSFEIILELGQIDMSLEDQVKYCNKKNVVYLDYIKSLTNMDCLPGVHEFLLDAKSKGYKIALGSASKNAIFILEQLGITYLFDAIVDGTHVSRAKPDPEVFIQGALKLSIKPEVCIVFEDAIAGIQAAQRAKMKVVGVGAPHALLQADYHITSFENLSINELEEALKEF